MYWFTGYIFDTFNELIQMFYARKDLPSIIAAVLSIRLPFKRRVQARSRDPASAARGGGRRLAAPRPPALPPFLGQNAFDGYSVTAICARRWRSVIHTHCYH